MEIIELKRVFKYDDKELDDPNPNFTINEVKKFYASTYPELINASVNGPNIENDVQVFEFGKNIGTKG